MSSTTEWVARELTELRPYLTLEQAREVTTDVLVMLGNEFKDYEIIRAVRQAHAKYAP